MATPYQQYQQREAKYARELQSLERSDRRLSNLRLGAFSLGVAAVAALYFSHYPKLAALAGVGFAALFTCLVICHDRLGRRIKYAALLWEINCESLRRLQGQWSGFPDGGAEFCEDSHPYSGDLDIFGRHSLFQWTNTARTYLGRRKLRDLFLGVEGGRQAILERQEAVAELAPKLSWRQNFQAEARASSRQTHDPAGIAAWGQEGNAIYRRPRTIWLARICPALTGALALAAFALDLIHWAWPVLALVGQFLMLVYRGKERHRTFAIAEAYGEDLGVYFRMLKLFEEGQFTSQLLARLAQGLRNEEEEWAHAQLSKLTRLLDAMANRRNAFYLLFNTATLWDFHILIALEKWKQQSGRFLADWFDALGAVEALASLAQIRFDNPSWAMPKISSDAQPYFLAKGLGHPLLLDRVNNNLTLGGKKTVLLITGSNMSGKSTLLRTAGINLVLAYAGAPVCAQSLEASIMDLHVCMRVADNLGENVSSFYAELLRIKEIVGSAQSGKRVFFLLDEVFKGTNSRDRHTGAKALINKLSATNSIGLVSTHDLELCDLERENPRLANYHFLEFYRDGKIHFDYRLRPGPSTTRNALYLMELAGIQVEE